MLKTNDLAIQAKGATLRFLKRKGYGILDSEPEDFGAVVEDDGCIVFVEIRLRDGAQRGFNDSPLDRRRFELAAASWLAEHDEVGADMPVRLDIVSLLVLDSGRALLRHHINASEG